MKYHLVCMYDARVESFMTPVAVVSIPQAQRSFLKEVSEGGDAYDIRNDVSLFHLGSFDETTGEFEGADCPRKISSGS